MDADNTDIEIIVGMYRQRKFADALQETNSRLKVHPDSSQLYNIQGMINIALKQDDEAILSFNNAVKRDASHASAHYNLGVLLRRKGRFKESVESYKKAIHTNPGYVQAHNNLGTLLKDQGKYKEAIDCFKKAVKLKPDHYTAYYNMGLTYLNLSDNKEAISTFKKAVDIQPDHTLSLNSLAEVLHLTGKTNEAIEIFKKIIKIKPDFDKAYFNLSLIKLMFSKFKEGWQQYEYRWKVKPFREVKWPFAREEMWNNEEGKRVSLWKEQGIGDEIIFLGLVPEAKERSQSLAVYIDPRLVPLCERSMPGIKFFGDTKEFEKQAFDYHMPMGSLPRLFRSDIKDFDRTAHGYLKADKLRVDTLRQEMGLEGKRVIGISWKSIRSLTTSKKSMMLKDFGMMFKGMDVVLLNLQYGDVQEEIDEFTQATGIEILQCKSVDNREDLDGLAALIELCDLVVSTSNITIHLAGALGKETWVLLPYVANFWWLLDRTDSIWYPTLRLYRQKTLDDWGGVLSNINKDLEKKFGE